MLNKNKVLIGCPVRDRGWILPSYLKHLTELAYPPELVEYGFIVNDCCDNTLNILQGFREASSSPVHIEIKNLGSRTSSVRGGYSISNLVILRNFLLELFLSTDCTHLFSIDSDILVQPHILTELVNVNLPVVSALVRNDVHLGLRGFYNILELVGDRFQPLINFPYNQVIQVDCTGAVYLIQRRVIEELGVRYQIHLQGEDAGFCEIARSKGIKIWCHTGLHCTHVMVESN